MSKNEKKKTVQEDQIKISRISLAMVEKLEDASKIGFFCESKEDANYLAPSVRLAVEGAPNQDGSHGDPVYLTPWCSVSDLSLMIQGVMFLHPLIIKIIKDRQANAPSPEENN